MEVRTNIPLKNFTTMKLGGNTRFMVEVRTPVEIQEVSRNAQSQKLPIFVLGGGSNVIARDEGFNGLIIRIRIPGFEIITNDVNTTTIKIGAGEEWDTVVKRCVDMNLSGIEAMSAIPGSTGGTPIQNVGAYGQEIGDTLESVNAYDTVTDTFVTISKDECQFSYRQSIFRAEAAGRYIISYVTLKLSKSLPKPPFYGGLQAYLDEKDIHLYTPEIIRDAVVAIRSEKLPDPAVFPNTGSFFKNSIIEDWQLEELLKTHPTMPSFDMGEKRHKVPTGWLIEQAGFKGVLLHGIRVHEKNCLVLINESATSYTDLVAAKDEIIKKVHDIFGIIIEQEPLEI